MKIAKTGVSVGVAMMAFGAASRVFAKSGPKSDPHVALMDEGGGSFIVFGAAVTVLSLALRKRES